MLILSENEGKKRTYFTVGQMGLFYEWDRQMWQMAESSKMGHETNEFFSSTRDFDSHRNTDSCIFPSSNVVI